MKNKFILLSLAGLIIIMATAMFLVTKDISAYKCEIRETITFFNEKENINFYMSGHDFDEYFKDIKKSNHFTINEEIPYGKDVNIYIINLETEKINSSDYKKINELLLKDEKIIIYFIGGIDFSFLEGYQSLSLDKFGNHVYINTDSYIHRIDNLVGRISMSSVDLSGRDKKIIFSDYTYLQFLVYNKIKRDVIKYF